MVSVDVTLHVSFLPYYQETVGGDEDFPTSCTGSTSRRCICDRPKVRQTPRHRRPTPTVLSLLLYTHMGACRGTKSGFPEKKIDRVPVGEIQNIKSLCISLCYEK